MDGSQGSIGEVQGLDHRGQIGSQQNNVGGLAGHVGGLGDGDAQVGRGQCRRIVDTVSHEGHLKPPGLNFAQDPHLVLGSAFGTHPFRRDAHGLGHGLTRGAGVA